MNLNGCVGEKNIGSVVEAIYIHKGHVTRLLLTLVLLKTKALLPTLN